MNIDLTTAYLGLPLKNPPTLEDVLKAMFAGANATMLASALLQSRVGRVVEILGGMARRMEATLSFDPAHSRREALV